MDSNTFTTCMDQLQDHFNKRLKDAGQYWEALHQLPGDAFVDICKARIWNHSPNPGQFPTIQGLVDDWQAWLKKHPHRQEIIRWEFCPYCEDGSPGLIEVRIPLEEPIYPNPESNYRNTLVRCGHCNNAQHRNPTWPRHKREEMQGKGWEIVTEIHTIEDEEDISVPRPPKGRQPGVTHIEQSLPIGDREE